MMPKTKVGLILRILLIEESKMKRNEAISKLAKIKLEQLTTEEREDQLETLRVENWESDSEWKQLPLGIRMEFFNSAKLRENPDSKRYDDVLLVWIKDGFKATANEYLMKEIGCENIEGEPVKFEACPCCGRRTLETRGQFTICRVCWWEDDSQDNESADVAYGGPNYGISLTEGRYNFLTYGIYDPNREDLRAFQEEKDKYILEREFQISENGFIVEVGTDWKGKVKSFE